MKRILAFLALFASGFALAGTATLTWTNPTTNTDGSALTQTGVNVYRGSSATGPWTEIGSVVAAGGVVPATYTDAKAVDGATESYYVTAVSATGESAPSAVVSKAIPLPLPNPPTNLTVTAVTAYQLAWMKDNRFALIPWGHVALGSPCVGGVSLGGLHGVAQWRIKRANISQPAGAWMGIFVAKCG